MKNRERERLKCFHAKLVNSIYFSWRIPLDDGVINDLRENPAHRYSFVCNAMLHICNTQDTDRCVQSTVTCYELTNKYEVYIHKCIILNLVVLLENIQGIPKIKNKIKKKNSKISLLSEQSNKFIFQTEWDLDSVCWVDCQV